MRTRNYFNSTFFILSDDATNKHLACAELHAGNHASTQAKRSWWLADVLLHSLDCHRPPCRDVHGVVCRARAGHCLYIVWAAFGVATGIMIWNLYRHSFVWLWIYFGITALLLAMRIADLIFVAPNRNFHEITLIFRSAIYSTAWFLYFKRSDRVKETFGRNL
jgi:Protein of unknown function (DUF2569)